jgi:hypothetical protein
VNAKRPGLFAFTAIRSLALMNQFSNRIFIAKFRRLVRYLFIVQAAVNCNYGLNATSPGLQNLAASRYEALVVNSLFLLYSNTTITPCLQALLPCAHVSPAHHVRAWPHHQFNSTMNSFNLETFHLQPYLFGPKTITSLNQI